MRRTSAVVGSALFFVVAPFGRGDCSVVDYALGISTSLPRP